MSPRCIVPIGNNVVLARVQSFWAYSGSVQPLPCEVQDWFFSLVNRQMLGRVFGSPNPTFSEAWWDWPDEGSLEYNRYIAMNYSDQGRPWTIGVRSRTAADPVRRRWTIPMLGGPDASSTGGCLYLHEYGMTDNGVRRGGTGHDLSRERRHQLGEGDKRYHVRQMALDAAVAASREIEKVLGWRFFTHEQTHDTMEYDTGTYTVTHDGLMDVRFSGRIVRDAAGGADRRAMGGRPARACWCGLEASDDSAALSARREPYIASSSGTVEERLDAMAGALSRKADTNGSPVFVSLVLVAPNGARWLVTVDNLGALKTEEIA